jgi:ATP-dependent Zn protease
MMALVGVSVSAAALTSPARDAPPLEPTFAAFLGQLEQGELRDVVLRTRDNRMRVAPADGPAYEVGYPPEYAGELVERLRSAGVHFDVKPGGSSASRMLRLALPVALLVGVWMLVVRRRAGAGGQAGAFRRAPAKEHSADAPPTRFGDVAGVDEALEELREPTSDERKQLPWRKPCIPSRPASSRSAARSSRPRRMMRFRRSAGRSSPTAHWRGRPNS